MGGTQKWCVYPSAFSDLYRMCGIAGILTVNASAESGKHSRDITQMTRVLAHRGPDGEAIWQRPGGGLFFGHRRLSIIDLSEEAAQPMQYNNRFTIVYNGEIYNYKELRQSLLVRGCQFKSASDTEVILAAYQEYGPECVQYFDGMFAFAIWDETTSSLFFARDRFGEKPLYFAWQDDRLLFASEMKALWVAGVAKEADPHQILLYLGAGVTGIPLQPEQCFYTGIFQLPAAHTALFASTKGIWGELELTRYWDLYKETRSATSTTDAVTQFKALLTDSVTKRLRADVPVGSSLSGGVDSSSIAALAKKTGGTNWTGFSAIFPGFERDESLLIKELSEQLNIRSVGCSPGAGDLAADLDQLLYHQELPVESASALVQFKVMQLAAEHGVTVLLDGQGADELLGGYTSYIHWFLQEIWRSGPKSRFNEERKRFEAHHWKGWGWRNLMASWFPQAAQEQLINKQTAAIRHIPYITPDFVSDGLRPEDLFKPFVTSLNDILYYDMTMGRLPELLRYADRNSMAFGREIRLPYLSRELVEFVFSLPATYKMSNGYTKWVLRQAMSEHLPASIAWQTKKIGYEPPQAAWMQTPVMEERIREARKSLAETGVFQKRYLDRPIGTTAASQMTDWRVLVLGSLLNK